MLPTTVEAVNKTIGISAIVKILAELNGIKIKDYESSNLIAIFDRFINDEGVIR